MNTSQLEKRLMQLTDNEIYHLQYPNHTSNRYSRIEKVQINSEEIYLFKFNSLLKERNICLNKESRFTGIPKHIHSVIELNYVYNGECVQTINGKEVHLHQGDVCILDMNTTHEIYPLTEQDIIITIDMRKKYFIDGFLSRLSTQGLVSRFLVEVLSESHHRKQYLIFRENEEINIHTIIQNLLCEYYDFRICSNEIIDSYMIILFSELLRNYERKTQNTNHRKGGDETLLLILKYMESNYKTITLDSIAKIFGFHPNYLSAYIKKHTGKSYKELIITQRMLQAGFYLKNSNTSIADIAQEVGYHNLGFFYKKFFNYYHMSPIDYRKMNTS